MGSSDILTSAKGPGLIGSLLALVVLAGFGFLTLHVMDEAEREPTQSIESVIKYQEKDILGLREQVTSGEALVATEPMLKEQRLKLTNLSRENRYRADEVKALSDRVATGQKQLDDKLAEFEAYKNEYRKFIRTKSKGMRIEKLVTTEGTTYQGAVIREITPIGIQIVHHEGQKRLPYEILPAEMQDLFQFDPAQKQLALENELEARKKHEKAIADAAARESETKAAQSEAAKEKQANARNQALIALTAQYEKLQEDIEALEDAISMEHRKSISRAPQMRRQLDNMNKQLSAIGAKINQLQSQQ